MADRTYMAIDLKSFYASVECVDRGLDPLTANLVVADPERTDKTICLAVTPSLKACGIPGRCRLFEFKEKLREIKLSTGKEIKYLTAPPQMRRYIDVSSEIYGIYLDYFSPDDIHVYSIDEVFIDATEYLRLYGMTARELAASVIHSVLSETGITATAGIGTNLYLSKIAMDIVAKHAAADADGVRMAELDEMSYRKLLWDHTPITDFWHIGHGTAARLERCGMFTMGDVARASVYNEDRLYRMFGVDAELLIDHAWGYEPCTMADIKAYRPSANSVSSGQVLPRPYKYDEFLVVVREMASSLALDLFAKGLSTDTLTLDIGYDKSGAGTCSGVTADRYGRAVPNPSHGTAAIGTHTSSVSRITDAVMSLCERIADKSLPVRRVTICAANVLEAGCEQCCMFTDPRDAERERTIQRAMLDIKTRYGKNAILHGTSLRPGATMAERNRQIGGHSAERRRGHSGVRYE